MKGLLMDIKLTYTGRVGGDRIIIHRRKEMEEMIIHHFAGHEIELTIQRKRKRRSLMQNAYYYGVIIPIVCKGLNNAGYKVGTCETHEFLKSMFNRKDLVNEATGEILQTVGSTAAMSTVDMMDYFESITQWTAEYLNIEIPAPNEQIKLEL